jgi:hypothetical protein
MRWEGESSIVVSALCDARYIDRAPDGSLSVHDWLDHAPKYVLDRLRARTKRTIPAQAERPITPNVRYKGPEIRDNGGDVAEKQRPTLRSSSAPLPYRASHEEREHEADERQAPAPKPEPVAAIAAEMQSAAGDIGAAWTKADRQKAMGCARSLIAEGKPVPLVLEAWGRYCADGYWRSAGLPLHKFIDQFAKYAVAPKRPAEEGASRRAVGRAAKDVRLCDCGHPAEPFHALGTGNLRALGACRSTSCGCQSFAEMREIAEASR